MSRQADGDEILVVLEHGGVDVDTLRDHGAPVHAVSARVVTFELAPGTGPEDLRVEPSVRWAGVDPPEDLLVALDSAERLFVEGWRRRRTGKTVRPGDGEEWDAPGRLPPDPPPAADTSGPG